MLPDPIVGNPKKLNLPPVILNYPTVPKIIETHLSHLLIDISLSIELKHIIQKAGNKDNVFVKQSSGRKWSYKILLSRKRFMPEKPL